MQPVGDIFQIWTSNAAMAAAIGGKTDTVQRWRKRRRIPQDEWTKVIAAAATLGHQLTADDFLRTNAPMKPRGRPAHKSRVHNGDELAKA